MVRSCNLVHILLLGSFRATGALGVFDSFSANDAVEGDDSIGFFGALGDRVSLFIYVTVISAGSLAFNGALLNLGSLDQFGALVDQGSLPSLVPSKRMARSPTVLLLSLLARSSHVVRFGSMTRFHGVEPSRCAARYDIYGALTSFGSLQDAGPLRRYGSLLEAWCSLPRRLAMTTWFTSLIGLASVGGSLLASGSLAFSGALVRLGSLGLHGAL
jgi:hypothetical protein